MPQSKKRTIDVTTAEYDELLVECEMLQEDLISTVNLVAAGRERGLKKKEKEVIEKVK